MIDGIKLDFTTSQLSDHLQEREIYHSGKATFYNTQVGALTSGGVEQQSISNDPVSSLRQSREGHIQKSELFKVMREHLVQNETYRLTQGDLVTLEIISNRW